MDSLQDCHEHARRHKLEQEGKEELMERNLMFVSQVAARQVTIGSFSNADGKGKEINTRAVWTVLRLAHLVRTLQCWRRTRLKDWYGRC